MTNDSSNKHKHYLYQRKPCTPRYTGSFCLFLFSHFTLVITNEHQSWARTLSHNHIHSKNSDIPFYASTQGPEHPLPPHSLPRKLYSIHLFHRAHLCKGFVVIFFVWVIVLPPFEVISHCLPCYCFRLRKKDCQEHGNLLEKRLASKQFYIWLM